MAKKTRKAKARKEMRYSNTDTYLSRQSPGGKSIVFNLPSGAKLWRPKKKGMVKLEIIPYEVGTHNPEAEEGMFHWELSYKAHKKVGAGQHAVLCPLEWEGKQCPVCDLNAKMRQDPDFDDDELNKPKHRQLFNIFVHGEEDEGIQLFEYSYHQFGKHLVEALEICEEDNIKDFFHTDKSGCTLGVGFKENPPYGYEVARIDFFPRKKALDAALVESAYDLEEIVSSGLKPYKTIKKLILQTPKDEDEDDEDEELEDEEVDDDEDVEEIDDDEDVEDFDDDEDEEDEEDFDDDEDEEDEEDFDDDDDEGDDEEDDDDEEEEIKPKKSKSKSKNTKAQSKSKKSKSSKSSKKKDEEDDDDDDDDDDDEDWR